jgi:Zn finger protein HypA/HybF involved in hydrogenase expression
MSPDEQARNDRAQQAAKILENPQAYKVCEGCGSIVTARTTACPNCHAYQFDLDESRVAQQAHALAKRGASSVLSSDLA